MTEQILKPILSHVDLKNSFLSFNYFNNNIYPAGFSLREPYKHGAHLNVWADMMQAGNSCIISGRKSSKSNTVYSYLDWRIWKAQDYDLEILYMSFKDKLAKYHIKKFKRLTKNNPHFVQLMDQTPFNVEGIAKYSWDGKHRITIEPAGVLSFERGKHPDILILDDVLADPTDQLNLKIIEKINTKIMEVAFSLPKEGGVIQAVGTAQTPIDFMFDLKKLPHFKWGFFPAITNWKLKKVLWPEQFPWERLMQIRNEIGKKAFDKEYMCKPVWSTDSFFSHEDIMATVHQDLKNYNTLRTKNTVGMGWDIGKHSHPAYVTVFEFIPVAKEIDMAVQRHIMWMDNWDYKRQLDYVKGLVDRLQADYVNYDNTRGELEGFYEKGYMNKTIFHPINFNLKQKNAMASEYEKRVTHETDQGTKFPLVMHINHQRSINQVLTVTNDLQAVATHEGHGDSFWGNALALWQTRRGGIAILEDPENVSGLF